MRQILARLGYRHPEVGNPPFSQSKIFLRWGRIKVTLVNSVYNAFYTVRTFDVYEDLGRMSPDRRISYNGSTASEMDSEYANVPSVRNGKAASPDRGRQTFTGGVREQGNGE